MPAELHALCTRQQAQRGHLGSASALPHSLTTPSALLSKLFCSVLQLAKWFITPVEQGQLSRFSTRRVGGGLGAWTGARRKMGTSAADAEKKLEDKVQAGAPRIVTVRAACLCTYSRLDTRKSALPRERP